MLNWGLFWKFGAVVFSASTIVAGVAGYSYSDYRDGLLAMYPEESGGSEKTGDGSDENPPIEIYSGTEVTLPEKLKGKLHLFLTMGQSNMSGYAHMPEEGPESPEGMYVFGNDDKWHDGSRAVDSALAQVDDVSKDDFSGYSPLHIFAKEYLNIRKRAQVGLIICSKGSSHIQEWARPKEDPEDAETLYGSCLRRYRLAAEWGRLRGILFFQGESDAKHPVHFTKAVGSKWAAEFRKFIEDLRKDLNEMDYDIHKHRFTKRKLPVVFAQIGPTATAERFTNWEDVQTSQEEAQDIERSKMIVTRDLPVEEFEHLHFTVEGYREIGRRFARGYFDITDPTAAARIKITVGEPIDTGKPAATDKAGKDGQKSNSGTSPTAGGPKKKNTN